MDPQVRSHLVAETVPASVSATRTGSPVRIPYKGPALASLRGPSSHSLIRLAPIVATKSGKNVARVETEANRQGNASNEGKERPPYARGKQHQPLVQLHAPKLRRGPAKDVGCRYDPTRADEDVERRLDRVSKRM
jgi:hypothetical protein